MNDIIPNFPAYCSKSSSGVGPNIPFQIESALDFDSEIKKSSSAPEPKQNIGIMDNLLYIYTSGTTGLPKAVNITHMRYSRKIYILPNCSQFKSTFRHIFVCISTFMINGLRSDDIIYNTLPLYHSSGGQIGAAGAFFQGSTTVIRKKFSAKNFFKDCKKYNATVRLVVIKERPNC